MGNGEEFNLNGAKRVRSDAPGWRGLRCMVMSQICPDPAFKVKAKLWRTIKTFKGSK